MKSLKPGDFTRTDVETNKQFTLSESSSLVSYAIGKKGSANFNTGSASTFNDFYQSPLYGSIKSQFYLEPYRTSATQSLHDSVGMIQISQNTFDKKIKEGSVKLVTDSGSVQNYQTFFDDGNGNLYLSGSNEHIGNVFYEFGTVVVTNTGSDDYTSYVTSGSFDITYRATHIKTELDFSATVQPNEFNYSTNPSVRINGKDVLKRPHYSYKVSEVSSSYGEGIVSRSIIPEFFGIYPNERIRRTYITNYVNRSTPDITTSDWSSIGGTSNISQSLNVEAPPISGSWETSASKFSYTTSSQDNTIRGSLGRVFNDYEEFAVSLYARTDTSGSQIKIDVSDDVSPNISLDTNWKRISYTGSKIDTVTEQDFGDIHFQNEDVNYYVWGFQIEHTKTVNEFIETNGHPQTELSKSIYTTDENEDTERLTPYATTIGFYNERNELLASGKLASPTPIPYDFPITFRAKIDI